MSAPPTEAIVRLERVSATHALLPLTLGVTLGNAALTVAVLFDAAETGALAAWFAAVVLLCALRLAGWLRFRAAAGARSAAPWERVAVAGAIASGLLWGGCVALVMPAEAPYPLFLAFVIGGMCAGAVTVHAVHLPSALGFIVPACLPLAVFFATRGDGLSAAMAAMVVVFAASLTLAAQRSDRAFVAGVRMRLALAERTRALDAANTRLRAEIAERGEAEGALRQAQKLEAVGGLTAGLAHDFNNLLLVIGGNAEALQDCPPEDAPAHLEVIAGAVDRGRLLIRRLLAFGRSTALAPRATDANALLHGLVSLLGATLGARIRTELRLATDLWPALVDAGKIEHAVLNLVLNARDAMPEGGTLTIATANAPRLADAADLPGGDFVRISVRDTGTGMPEAVQARAFDPFFSTKPGGEGSGLGLSQVYGLVRQSGGGVRLESVPGEGTTVTLLLPRAAAGAGPAEEAAREAAARPSA